MNQQIRRVSLVMLALFLLLMGNLVYWQVVRADQLSNDPRNTRTIIKEYSIQRGRMIAHGADGKDVVVAESVPTDDALKYLRKYPQGRRYGFVTGYYSLVFGRSLAEAVFNQFLIGQAPEQFAQNLVQLVSAEDKPGGNLVLTIDPKVQAAAEDALGDNKGAVVAMEPASGAVLALTSFPRYDPNALSTHDTDKMRSAWKQLNEDEDKPLLSRATAELYPPGSTFKLVTAAAALQDGMTPDSGIENSVSYTPPQTRVPIRNFGGEACLGNKQPITLAEALEVSCNTAFARLGNDLGTGKFVGMAEKFGLNAEPPYQLPAATSLIPTRLDPPALAQSAIGQRDVRVTPLQMVTVTATIANDGRRMAPFVVSKVLADDGSLVKSFKPKEVEEVLSAEQAGQMRSMMERVVAQGTGTAAQINGATVGGKTGTAQHRRGANPHAWFTGYAFNGDRSIAVAVIVESGGDLGSEATGGKVAAPIAKAVMEAYLGGAS
ncbi:MAG TPA: penicillin-binding transpeptidase domain-containing protein [Actinomycetes bacterium]|nr:penicillin-binding transpeptidase domain-containing protein [Actinomycetes bacterium]